MSKIYDRKICSNCGKKQTIYEFEIDEYLFYDYNPKETDLCEPCYHFYISNKPLNFNDINLNISNMYCEKFSTESFFEKIKSTK